LPTTWEECDPLPASRRLGEEEIDGEKEVKVEDEETDGMLSRRLFGTDVLVVARFTNVVNVTIDDVRASSTKILTEINNALNGTVSVFAITDAVLSPTPAPTPAPTTTATTTGRFLPASADWAMPQAPGHLLLFFVVALGVRAAL